MKRGLFIASAAAAAAAVAPALPVLKASPLSIGTVEFGTAEKYIFHMADGAALERAEYIVASLRAWGYKNVTAVVRNAGKFQRIDVTAQAPMPVQFIMNVTAGSKVEIVPA